MFNRNIIITGILVIEQRVFIFMCTMTRYLQIHYAKLAINNNLSLLQGPSLQLYIGLIFYP